MIANILTREATLYKVKKNDSLHIVNVNEKLEEDKVIKVQIYNDISRKIETYQEYNEENITLITNNIDLVLNQVFEFEGTLYKVVSKKKRKPYMASQINVGTIFKGIKYG